MRKSSFFREADRNLEAMISELLSSESPTPKCVGLLEVQTYQIQEKPMERPGRINSQETESEKNELRTVNQMGGLSTPISYCEKTTLETILQIASAQVIFSKTLDESRFDLLSYHPLREKGTARSCEVLYLLFGTKVFGR
jgi:hypothetical protein